jgi:hypothetical protein
VGASGGANVVASVWASGAESAGASVEASAGASVEASAGASAGSGVGAGSNADVEAISSRGETGDWEIMIGNLWYPLGMEVGRQVRQTAGMEIQAQVWLQTARVLEQIVMRVREQVHTQLEEYVE